MYNFVDIVICSKNREQLAYEQIERVKKYIPYANIYLFDNSDEPYKFKKVNIFAYHVPKWKLGNIRTLSFNISRCNLYMSLDDDIVINENTFNDLLKCLYSDDKNIGVSALIIDGYPNNKTIMKLYENKRKYSYAMGCCLFKRDMLIKYIGGFIDNIHYGEDILLAYRIRKKGYNWNICNTKVYHHVNGIKNELTRHFKNTKCIIDLWKIGNINLINHLAISVGRILIMPFYYAIKTKDIKVYFLYFGICLVKMIGNFYHFFKGFKRWFD